MYGRVSVFQSAPSVWCAIYYLAEVRRIIVRINFSRDSLSARPVKPRRQRNKQEQIVYFKHHYVRNEQKD